MYKQNDTFVFWAQKVLPLVYDESLSYYEVICKVVDYINNMIENQKGFSELLAQHSMDIDKLTEEVKYVSTELDKVKNGDYTSMYINSLSEWINSNLQEMVYKVVKFIQFELDDTGHLIAFIPDTWDFIDFDTIMESDSENYGKLVVEW